MELKNYQEDVVLGLIDVLLEDEPEYREDRRFVYDVAAYTLNRIPPKYFMSERGFTRFADLYLTDEDSPESFANLVELSVIVNHAIETVKQRRTESVHESIPAASDEQPVTRYIHNFPHMLGKALDAKTNRPVDGAVVTLSSNGKVVAPAAEGWPNPYHTSPRGKGYFSFWPRHLVHDSQTLSHAFRIEIVHDGYEPFTYQFELRTEGSFEHRRTVRNESIMKLETCLLTPTS